MDAEQTLAKSETSRKELMKKVAHFEKSAKRALSFSSKLIFRQVLASVSFSDLMNFRISSTFFLNFSKVTKFSNAWRSHIFQK